MAISMLALLDDISSTLDDIAAATKRTSSLVADDIAVGAEGIVGVTANREIPLVAKIMALSFVNKLFVAPIILALSYFLPGFITPLLILGALYLSFEGAEKVWHAFGANHHNLDSAQVEPARSEAQRVRDTQRIDVILSFEVLLISLDTVINEPLQTQAIVLGIMSIVATLFIYGVVLLVLRLDDMAVTLLDKGPLLSKVGRWVISFAPKLMKALSVIGTVAMGLVGGDLLIHSVSHYIPSIEHVLAETLPTHTSLHSLSMMGVSLLVAFLCGSMLVKINSLRYC